MSFSEQDQWVVLGATLTAFGLAASRPGVVIVESTAGPASEFAGAFYPGDGSAAAPVSTQARELEAELTGLNILDSGRYHVAALVPVLMRRILNHHLNVSFWTDLIGFEPGADGTKEVVIINASGRRTIRAARIIDTTAESHPCIAPRRWTEKRLWANLHGRTLGPAVGDVLWQPGRFASEQYFGVRLDPRSDWPEARGALLKAWQNRPAFLADTRIAALATEFQYTFATPQVSPAPGITHVPSAAFPTPLAAFDAGVRLAAEVRS
jgi:hypothetical protein